MAVLHCPLTKGGCAAESRPEWFLGTGMKNGHAAGAGCFGTMGPLRKPIERFWLCQQQGKEERKTENKLTAPGTNIPGCATTFKESASPCSLILKDLAKEALNRCLSIHSSTHHKK